METSKLSGTALDWAVAKAEGYTDLHKIEGRMPHEPQLGMFPPRREYGVMDLWELSFSSDWNKGGWIIERERISITPRDGYWDALYHDMLFQDDGSDCYQTGTTPLEAAMRCYVTSKLGKEIELHEELNGQA